MIYVFGALLLLLCVALVIYSHYIFGLAEKMHEVAKTYDKMAQTWAASADSSWKRSMLMHEVTNRNIRLCWKMMEAINPHVKQARNPYKPDGLDDEDSPEIIELLKGIN